MTPTDAVSHPVYVPTALAVGISGRSVETLLRYHRQGLIRRRQISARSVLWHRGDLLRLVGVDGEDTDRQSEGDQQ